MYKPNFLTRADVRKIEETLNTADLEMMVATVDRIVQLRLARALKTSPSRRTR